MPCKEEEDKVNVSNLYKVNLFQNLAASYIINAEPILHRADDKIFFRRRQYFVPAWAKSRYFAPPLWNVVPLQRTKAALQQ